MSLSCSAGDWDPSETLDTVEERSICGGVDDMQDVEQYDGTLGPTVAFVMDRQPPVGNIKWKSDLASRYTNTGTVNGDRWCTATLLTEDTMITAGHCFDADINGNVWPRVNGTATPISAAQAALEMEVDFNYQVDPSGIARPITTVNVLELVEYRLGGVDYSVIRVAPPGAVWRTTAITPFSMQVGQPVTIIQHPNGEPKQVHSGPIASLTATAMDYSTADTEGGSSGSGVLNEWTGMIHAIHTNGGCDTGTTNRGVPVSAIYAVSPRIQTLAIDAAKLSAFLL